MIDPPGSPAAPLVAALTVIGSLGAAIAAVLTSDAVSPLVASLATMALAVALLALVLWVIRSR